MNNTDWQPIETAPRTSKAILVWTPQNKCTALVCWHPTDGAAWHHFYAHRDRLQYEPSHWMPVPIAPDVDAPSPEPIRRSFSREELIDKAIAWMELNQKGVSRSEYYTRLGILTHFITDITK